MGDSCGTTPTSADGCPNCGGHLSGQSCAACGLRLVGPAASRISTIDADLRRLADERRHLIDVLRAQPPSDWPPAAAPPPPPPPPPPPWLPPAPPGGWWGYPRPTPAGTDPALGYAPDPSAWSASEGPPVLPPYDTRRSLEYPGEPGSPPRQIQNVLLSLGAFSLIVAAVVFLAVTWRGLSAPAKSLTLVGLTAVFAGITTLLRRRSLTSTAEALAAVTVMLGLADAYAVRVGMFPHTAQTVFWGVACAVLALVIAGFARWSGATVARLASVVLIQLPAPLLAARHSASQTLLLGALLLQAFVVAALLRRFAPSDERVARVLRAGGGLAWIVGTAGAVAVAVSQSSQRPVAATLIAAAGFVTAFVAWQWPEEADLQLIAAGITSASVLGAVATLEARWFDGDALAISTVALAVVLAGVAARVDRRWASGPMLVASVAAVGVSAPAWPQLAAALRAPWWAGNQIGVWAGTAGRSAGAIGVPAPLRTGPGATLAYLALLAAGAWALRSRIGRRRSDWSLAALGGLAASTLPLAVGATVWSATVILLVIAVAVSTAVLARVALGDQGQGSAPWWSLAIGAAGQALAWALLAPGLTLVALVTIGVAGTAAVIVGVRRPAARVANPATVVASVAVAASVLVAARVVGASPAVGWTALSLVAAAASAVCFIAWSGAGRGSVRRERGAVTEVAAILAGIAAASYTVGAAGVGAFFPRGGTPGLLAGVFGAGSVSALVVASTAIRRRLGEVGAIATALATLLGLATVGVGSVQAGLDPAAVWLTVMAAAAVITLVAMLTEVAAMPVDVVAAIDGSAAVGAVLALLGLITVATADQVSVGLLLATLALALEATRPSRRLAVWAAALGALVLLWQRLALGGVTTAEAFTLPAAALLASFAIWRHRRDPLESSWVEWGPALLVALGPSVLLALRDPGLLRPVATVIAAAVVTLVGARWQRRAPVAIGAAALVALGLQQLAPFVRQLPRWVTFAAVGTLLLMVGASYERRRAQLVDLRSQYRRLH